MSAPELSQEDLEKVRRLKEKAGEYDVDNDTMLLAEFGIHFGFEGIRAIVNNEIKSLDDAYDLIKAARKLKGIK